MLNSNGHFSHEGNTSMSTAPVAPRRPRWWPALLILAAEACAIAWIVTSESVQSWLVFPFTMLAVFGALLLLAVWLLFLSRLRWRTRLIGVGVGIGLAAASVAGVMFLTRWEGS